MAAMGLPMPSTTLFRKPITVDSSIRIQSLEKQFFLQFNAHGRQSHSFIRPSMKIFALEGNGNVARIKSQVHENKELEQCTSLEEGYVGLFVRLLGLDKPIEEREEAVQALWRHSEGGKECVDEIVQFPGCLNLVVSLIMSDRPDAAEGAAGLLRNVSAINAYRSLVADAGALEEAAGLLTRFSAPHQVREQATCLIWNLSTEESYRKKILKLDLLPTLVSMLESSHRGERDAAAGILANIALSEINHETLIKSGAISKLVKLLKEGLKESKTARQEARNALLELSKNDDARVTIIEEGLVFVPLIGASAYRSFKPLLHSPPPIPENVKVEQWGSKESPFGARDLLLGLNVGKDASELDSKTQLAIEGRTRQQFLARLGAVENEASFKDKQTSTVTRSVTIMPWWDAIPRLVLILGLGDFAKSKLAAESIAEIAFSEENRMAVAKAGGIPHLVSLLGSGDEDATEAAAYAIEKLAMSNDVRKSIDAHGAVPALVAILKAPEVPASVQEKVVAALLRLSQNGNRAETMVKAEAIPGLIQILSSKTATSEAKSEAEDILQEISFLKAEPRDKIVAGGGIPPLLEMLSNGSRSQKEKAILVLENLATKEAHAFAMIESGIGDALKCIFELEVDEDINDDGIYNSAVICAASRLLIKLLQFPKARKVLDCKQYAILLYRALVSKTSLNVKDWVSACLINMASVTDLSAVLDAPINLEVTVYDIIPRLVESLESTADVQERAVLDLRDLVSKGIPAYATAVAKSGGISPLVKVLDVGSPAAREAAISILHSLAMDEDNHPAILAAKAVPVFERLVRAEVPSWQLALHTLRALPT